MDGLYRCYGCHSEFLPEKLVRQKDEFPCRHKRTPDNLTYRHGEVRCKVCVKRADEISNKKKFQRDAKAQWRFQATELERVWR